MDFPRENKWISQGKLFQFAVLAMFSILSVFNLFYRVGLQSQSLLVISRQPNDNNGGEEEVAMVNESEDRFLMIM